MPVMDGVALIKKIREAKPRPRVILVTGYNDLALPEAYALGVDAVVEKPIDRGELLDAMRSCLANVDSHST
jgi:two-component system response regulator YesN